MLSAAIRINISSIFFRAELSMTHLVPGATQAPVANSTSSGEESLRAEGPVALLPSLSLYLDP